MIFKKISENVFQVPIKNLFLFTTTVKRYMVVFLKSIIMKYDEYPYLFMFLWLTLGFIQDEVTCS